MKARPMAQNGTIGVEGPAYELLRQDCSSLAYVPLEVRRQSKSSETCPIVFSPKDGYVSVESATLVLGVPKLNSPDLRFVNATWRNNHVTLPEQEPPPSKLAVPPISSIFSAVTVVVEVCPPPVLLVVLPLSGVMAAIREGNGSQTMADAIFELTDVFVTIG